MDTNSDQDKWIENRLEALRPAADWQPDTVRGLARFRKQRDGLGRRRRRLMWVAGAAVVAGLPLMAFPSTRAFAQRCVSACVSQSNWVMDLFAASKPKEAFTAGYVKPAGRKMAPDFVLKDASGRPVRLSELHGQVVLLNFWATWCAPCGVEIPWFVEFEKSYQDRGFGVLGVSLDEDGWDAIKPYTEQRRVNYRVVAGNDAVAQLYGAESLPMTLVIDRSGRIASTHVGLCSKNEYQSVIQTVLAERE
jgi:peroxiredoxin